MKLNCLFLIVIAISWMSCSKNSSSPGPTPGPTGTWTNTNFSVTGTTGVWSMLVTKGDRILVGVNVMYGTSSLYTSTDGGASWRLADSLNSAKINGVPFCIKQDPVTNRILVGCNASQLMSLFTSADDGKTWTDNPNVFVPLDFAFGNNKSYMAISNGVSPTPPQDLMSSTDDFTSNWVNCTPSGTTFTPYRLLYDNGNLFTGTIGANGLWKTANPEGKIFTRTDNGITWANPGTSWVQCIKRIGNYLFTGTTDGLFRSADGGSTWSPSNLGFSTSVNDMASFGTDIYIALKDSAVYRSSDNGSTWSAFHQGLTLPLTVNCLQVMDNSLLEGDANAKVYKMKLN